MSGEGVWRVEQRQNSMKQEIRSVTAAGATVLASLPW
jgi:hypothetical protein